VGAVELIEPLHPDTTIARFLERHGPGLHHIAYRTEDLESELARLESAGLTPIDRTPRTGAHGHRIAFLHPSGTGGVLVELVEAANAP
jgi:methylmalonyl-CoA/ethylmalonyl-CoA epimerase